MIKTQKIHWRTTRFQKKKFIFVGLKTKKSCRFFRQDLKIRYLYLCDTLYIIHLTEWSLECHLVYNSDIHRDGQEWTSRFARLYFYSNCLIEFFACHNACILYFCWPVFLLKAFPDQYKSSCSSMSPSFPLSIPTGLLQYKLYCYRL